MVPRWQVWAMRRVIDLERLAIHAVQAGLLWRTDHRFGRFFARTAWWPATLRRKAETIMAARAKAGTGPGAYEPATDQARQLTPKGGCPGSAWVAVDVWRLLDVGRPRSVSACWLTRPTRWIRRARPLPRPPCRNYGDSLPIASIFPRSQCTHGTPRPHCRCRISASRDPARQSPPEGLLRARPRERQRCRWKPCL
jgi:hypothetical protein